MTLYKTLRAVLLIIALIFLMYLWNTRAPGVSRFQKEFEEKLGHLKNADFKTKIYVDDIFYGTYFQKDDRFRLDLPGETTIVVGARRKNRITVIDLERKIAYEGTLEKEVIEKYLSRQGIKIAPFPLFDELKNYKWVKSDSNLWQGRLFRLQALVKFDNSNRFLTHIKFRLNAPAGVSERQAVEKIEYRYIKPGRIGDNVFKIPEGFQNETLKMLKGELILGR